MKIAPSKIAQLFEKIDSIEKSLAISNMITEKEAAVLLGIKPATLARMVYKEQIGEDVYTVAVNGTRFYKKDLLIGLKKAV